MVAFRVIAGADLCHRDMAALSSVKSPAIITNRLEYSNYSLTPS